MSTQSKSINKLAEVHHRQVKKGLETYGKPLHPFNGRSAYTDAMEEIVDIAAYVTQLEQERNTLKLALECLYGACSAFIGGAGSLHVLYSRFEGNVKCVVDMLEEVGCVIGNVPMGETFSEFSEVINELKGEDDAVFAHMPEVSAEIMDGGLVDQIDLCGDLSIDHADKFIEPLYVDVMVMDGDFDDGGCMGDTTPICPKCNEELEWDSGDSDVGWPGQWYCALCDREGVVEDEV